jgi:hypothetical protein
MANQTNSTVAPIHDSIIADLARRYEVDEAALAEYLAVANERALEFEAELKETHEVVEDSEDRLVVLAAHGIETREMDKHAVGQVDIDIPDEHGSRANLLQYAHDRQAKQYDYDAFGGKQDAAEATAAADVIIISKN